MNDQPASTSTPPRIQEQYGRLVSMSIPCDDITLLEFLRQHRGEPRFYWENSAGEMAFAGVGKALEITAYGAQRYQHVQQQAQDLFSEAVQLHDAPSAVTPRLFGGFAFRDDFVPDVAWADFTPAHFVLPHFQLTRWQDQQWLSIHVQVPTDEAPQGMAHDLEQALNLRRSTLLASMVAHHPPENAVQSMRYPLTYTAWVDMLKEAIHQIRSERLQKVVLARVAEARFAQRIDLQSALHDLNARYRQSYRFLFEPRPYHAFFGATPELLAGVNGDKLSTMALAGSIRRGRTPEEDVALGQDLLNSRKDRHEHQLVVTRILQRLSTIADDIQQTATTVATLSNIQHLHTGIVARLRQPNGVLPVVEHLHPTPALGGEPRDEAMRFIQAHEPVTRGWYAAPIGWVDSNMDGQFAVAIRSAVAQEKRVWMYAGAGIVADSEPQAEWDETALKFRPMLNALGLPEFSS